MNLPDAPTRCARACFLALLFCLLILRPASAAQPSESPRLLTGPDLVITKSHSGDFYQGQQNARFIITITNVGDATYTGGLLVIDSLPQGLVYTSMSDSQNLWTCTSYPASWRVECRRSIALAPGASTSFTLYTRVLTTASGTNVVDLTATGDVNPANNHAEDPVIIRSGPDLTVATQVENTLRQGQVGVVYTFTVSNVGTGPSAGLVTVTETLPEGLIPRDIVGAGWDCALATLTCTRSDPLPAPGTFPNIFLTVDVKQDATEDVVNWVTVTVDGDINALNNSDQAFSKLRQAADLTLTKQHDGDFRQGQADAVYRMWVTNAPTGPTISPITVTDFLPEGLEPVSMTGVGWECEVALVSCTYAGTLGVDDSTPPIFLTVRVAEDAPPLLTNHATVSGGGELVTNNNSAADPTKIIQNPDLTIAKTHTGDFYQDQQDAQFTITVSNVGAGPVFGDVLVQETLPEHYNWLTITDLSGLGWTCNLILLNCQREDDIGLLPGKSYPPITVTAHVDKDPYVLEVINTAEVTLAGERNTANNRAVDRAVVRPNVDLGILITNDMFFTQGEKGAKYLIKVNSHGLYPPDAPVTVTAMLPASLTGASMSGAGWQCALNTLTCTYSDVPQPGEIYPPITLTVNVAANAPNLVDTRALVSVEGDINPQNDLWTRTTAIYPAPDLIAIMSLDGYLIRGKSGAVFSVTISNAGGRADAPVTLHAPLAAGLSMVSMAGDGWTCDTAARTCTRDDLLHQGYAYPAVQITVSVAPGAPDTITHTVTVSGGGELNTANSSASITAPVFSAPAVVAEPQMEPGCSGGDVTFTARASGVPAPSVQWQRSADGGATWADLPGETGETLRVAVLSTSVGKSYRAVFANLAGEAFSQPAAIDLHDPLVYFQHPADQLTTLGQAVTFQAGVTGQPWVMTWQTSPDGAAWQAISGASGRTLTFVPAPQQNGWQVRALATNACGAVPSRPARLSVAHRSLYLPMLSR